MRGVGRTLAVGQGKSSKDMDNPDDDGPTHAYVLGHSDRELERPSTQARLIDPITRQIFRAAGIVPGMRVLDVGSGAGDVAFLAAEMVGDAGEVVGAERVPAAVAVARARAEARALRNVRFREGDPAEMTFAQPFDAIIGRYVLMFQRDPMVMLRQLAMLTPVVGRHESASTTRVIGNAVTI